MKVFKKIVGVYAITAIIVGLIFYPILPKLLNYPPYSINNEFQKSVDIGLTYTQQYMLIIAICFFIGMLLIYLKTKRVENLKTEDLKKYSIRNKKRITQFFNLPNDIYLINLIIPTISILFIYALTEGKLDIGTIKIALVILTIETLIALVIYIYCKNLISNILKMVFIDKHYIDRVISIKSRIFTVIFPMIIVALVFTSLLGYSEVIKEKSDYMFITNQMILNNAISKNDYISFDELKTDINKLKKEEDTKTFIIFNDGKSWNEDSSELSDFIIKYTLANSEKTNGRIYETYAIDSQGVVKKIKVNGNDIYIGLKYDVTSTSSLINLLCGILSLLIVNSIVLNYVSKSLANDTRKVADALNEIAHSKDNNYDVELPITSNDEIAELVIDFNEIQNLTKKNLNKIKDNEYVMQRQAQFAILGEFAGGLAHDLNSPLSAVKLDISTLRKYINSNKISAEDEVKEKLNGMLGNIDNSLNSMGNTIMGVRNQIRATGDTEREEFLLQDVIDGIKILFRSILMKNNCKLETNIPEGLKIYGEKNKLDRVIGNVIKNSIDAYVSIEKKGIVKVSAIKDNEKIIIEIKDEAGGIDDSIKNKIFKEIKTTKSEKGTGFGLYYSNTIIESSFKGRMYFDSKKGVGTTFYIEIPNVKEKQ